MTHYNIKIILFFILDAWYYGRLESKSLLVHMSPSVIKAMAAFVYLAVVKDILLCLNAKYWYKDEGMDLFTTRLKS